MALQIRRQAGMDIAASGFNAVVIALLRGGTELGWRRRYDHDRLRVSTPCHQRDGAQQRG